MSFLIRRDIRDIGNLGKGLPNTESPGQGDQGKAVAGAHIENAVLPAADRAHGIRGQTVFFRSQGVDDLFIDGDGKAAVIRPDPEPALRIRIEAVDILHRLEIVHMDEGAAVVAVEARIGPGPEHAVRGRRQGIGFPAGQAVRAVVHCPGIGRVGRSIGASALSGKGCFSPLVGNRSGLSKRPGCKYSKGQDDKKGGGCCFFPKQPAYVNILPEKADKENQENADGLVHKVRIILSNKKPDSADTPFLQVIDDRIAPDIRGHAARRGPVQRYGNGEGNRGKSRGQTHGAEEGVECLLPGSVGRHQGNRHTGHRIYEIGTIDKRRNKIGTGSDKNATDRSPKIGRKNCTDRVQPQGKGKTGCKPSAKKIGGHTGARQQNLEKYISDTRFSHAVLLSLRASLGVIFPHLHEEMPPNRHEWQIYGIIGFKKQATNIILE